MNGVWQGKAVLLALLSLPAIVSLACQRSPAEEAVGEPAALATTQSSGVTGIDKVVFVGKKSACDCTRGRVDGSWAALQGALGAPSRLPVRRLQVDVDGPAVSAYHEQRPIMVLPAIYFVDSAERVTELLQGEVTTDQVLAVLAPAAQP